MTEEEHPDFSVDLMLDALASRLGSQEIIAMQGYMIAESLRKCGIPSQVYSFLSIRGYTVMRRFSVMTIKIKEKSCLITALRAGTAMDWLSGGQAALWKLLRRKTESSDSPYRPRQSQ